MGLRRPLIRPLGMLLPGGAAGRRPAKGRYELARHLGALSRKGDAAGKTYDTKCRADVCFNESQVSAGIGGHRLQPNNKRTKDGRDSRVFCCLMFFFGLFMFARRVCRPVYRGTAVFVAAPGWMLARCRFVVRTITAVDRPGEDGRA